MSKLFILLKNPNNIKFPLQIFNLPPHASILNNHRVEGVFVKNVITRALQIHYGKGNEETTPCSPSRTPQLQILHATGSKLLLLMNNII